MIHIIKGRVGNGMSYSSVLTLLSQLKRYPRRPVFTNVPLRPGVANLARKGRLPFV